MNVVECDVPSGSMLSRELIERAKLSAAQWRPVGVGSLRIDNEVTFVTHTSATDVFDPQDHDKVVDSPTGATSVLVIDPS